MTTDRADEAYTQWQRERPDIDAFTMQVIGRLLEAAMRFERDHLNPLFARFHLRPGEFDVLATLYRSGSPHALTPTQLYEALMMSSGGMTNRIDRLEQAQLVLRQPNPQDRRSALVVLTPDGMALMNQLLNAHIDNERQLLSVLSLDEQQQLNELLKKLLTGLPAA